MQKNGLYTYRYAIIEFSDCVKAMYLSLTFCKVRRLSNVKNTVKNVNNFALLFRISIKNRKVFHFTVQNNVKTENISVNRFEYFLQENGFYASEYRENIPQTVKN